MVRVRRTAAQHHRRPARGGHKRPYRYRPGTRVMLEIRKLQKSTNLLIPKHSFQMLVRELLGDLLNDLRVTAQGFLGLQHAAEDYLVKVFKGADMCAKHGKRVTITPEDIKLALKVTDVVNGDEYLGIPGRF